MSRLPDLSIEEAKLVGYLLDVNHPEGGLKAQFFIGCGFDPADPKVFAYALAEHAIRFWPGRIKATCFGAKHVLEGDLATPARSAVLIRAVWQIRPDGRPWLVTAYYM